MAGFDLILFIFLYLLSVGVVLTFNEGKIFAVILAIGNMTYFSLNLFAQTESTMGELFHWNSAALSMALLTLAISTLVIFVMIARRETSSKLVVLSTLLPVNSALLIGAQRLDVISIFWIITIILISTIVALSHNKRSGAEESVQVFMKMSFILLFNMLGLSLFIYSTGSVYIFDVNLLEPRLFSLSVLLLIFSWSAWALIFPFNSWFIDISRSRSFELIGLIIISVIFPFTIKLLDVGRVFFNALSFNQNEIAISVWTLAFVSVAYNFLLASKVKNTGPYLAFISCGMLSLSFLNLIVDPIIYSTREVYTYVLLSCIPCVTLYILLSKIKNVGEALPLNKLKGLRELRKIDLFAVIYFLFLVGGFPLGALFWNRIDLLSGLQNSWGMIPVALHVIGVVLVVFPLFGLLFTTLDYPNQLGKGISWRGMSFTAETIRVIFLVVMLTLSISPNLLMTYL